VTPNRGMGVFCPITLTSCLYISTQIMCAKFRENQTETVGRVLI